jgi:hypothetical protein
LENNYLIKIETTISRDDLKAKSYEKAEIKIIQSNKVKEREKKQFFLPAVEILNRVNQDMKGGTNSSTTN